MQASKPHCLYRHFDEAGALLYVGISFEPTGRFNEHASRSAWASRTKNITVEWFRSRRLAALAEGQAIATEKPLYNSAAKYPAGQINGHPALISATASEARLLAQIMRFIAKHKMNATEFGMKAANNGALVTRLKQGKTLTMRTHNRVLDYLRRPRNGK